jgi:hypothetical protein
MAIVNRSSNYTVGTLTYLLDQPVVIVYLENTFMQLRLLLLALVLVLLIVI